MFREDDGIGGGEGSIVRDGFGFRRDALEAFEEVERASWESRGLREIRYESLCEAGLAVAYEVACAGTEETVVIFRAYGRLNFTLRVFVE